MLTVGTDTYVTIAEAADYILLNYTSQETKRTTWDALATSDMEIYLRRATKKIDSCQFQGIRSESGQALEFPRYFYKDAVGVMYDWHMGVYTATVPDDIKYAQIEEALELATPGDDTNEKELRSGPVKSYTIGHLSESYGTAAAKSTAAYTLNSSRAAALVEKFINGGYRIV